MSSVIAATKPIMVFHRIVDETQDLDVSEGSGEAMILQWPLTFLHTYQSNNAFNIQYQHVERQKDKFAMNSNAVETLQEQEPQQQQWLNMADYKCNENFECDLLQSLIPYSCYVVSYYYNLSY